jgi:hypothetical protein
MPPVPAVWRHFKSAFPLQRNDHAGCDCTLVQRRLDVDDPGPSGQPATDVICSSGNQPLFCLDGLACALSVRSCEPDAHCIKGTMLGARRSLPYTGLDAKLPPAKRAREETTRSFYFRIAHCTFGPERTETTSTLCDPSAG